MAMSDDVEKVVAGLTEAQCRALLALPVWNRVRWVSDLYHLGRVKCGGVLIQPNTIRALAERNLAWGARNWAGLLPLGLAVKERLEATSE